MSATVIVRTLLANNAALTALIPADQIRAGTLPIGTPMPAITLDQISRFERVPLGLNSPTVIATCRIQVTVFSQISNEGGDYATLEAAIELVRLALPNMRASVAGFAVDSIRPDYTAQPFEDTDLRLLSQSKDFMVQFYVQGA